MFRTERKISREELALPLGRLERGERCPTVEAIYKICEGLKISMSDLLNFDVDVKPTSEEAKHFMLFRYLKDLILKKKSEKTQTFQYT